MDSKQVKDLMEAYASVYSSLNEEEMEDAEKEGKESGKDEGGKHKEGKHKKGKEEPGEKKTEKEDKEDVEKVDEAMSSYDRNRKRAAQRAADRNAARDRGQTGNVPGVGYVSPRRERETWTDEGGRERHKSGARMPKKEDQKESFDLFDYLLEYLVAEGYADTNKAALAIMANMSEEWKQSIVEQMTVNVADVKGGTQAAKNAQAGMKGKDGQPLYKPGVGVGPDFKLVKGV